jgi:hypothetical protein
MNAMREIKSLAVIALAKDERIGNYDFLRIEKSIGIRIYGHNDTPCR